MRHGGPRFLWAGEPRTHRTATLILTIAIATRAVATNLAGGRQSNQKKSLLRSPAGLESACNGVSRCRNRWVECGRGRPGQLRRELQSFDPDLGPFGEEPSRRVHQGRTFSSGNRTPGAHHASESLPTSFWRVAGGGRTKCNKALRPCMDTGSTFGDVL